MRDTEDTAAEPRRSNAESVERILREVDGEMDEHAYPVRREDLAAHYGDTTVELPNETESLGDVFDRLTDAEYDTAREAKAAATGELTGVSIDPDEYNVECDLDPRHADRLGTVEDPLAEETGSPVEAEPPSEPEAVPDEPDPEGVYDGAEAVEPDDREHSEDGDSRA